MPIPVRFYSVTKEEFDAIMKKDAEIGSSEHDGDLFFVSSSSSSDESKEGSDNASTK